MTCEVCTIESVGKLFDKTVSLIFEMLALCPPKVFNSGSASQFNNKTRCFIIPEESPGKMLSYLKSTVWVNTCIPLAKQRDNFYLYISGSLVTVYSKVRIITLKWFFFPLNPNGAW